MRRILYISFIGMLFLACSKESVEDEEKPDPNLITHASGYGAIVLGALGSGEGYLVNIYDENKEKFVYNTLVHRFPNVKSPDGCRLQDTRVRTIKLKAGKYTLRVWEPGAGSENYVEYEENVVEGKCLAIELSGGYAW